MRKNTCPIIISGKLSLLLHIWDVPENTSETAKQQLPTHNNTSNTRSSSSENSHSRNQLQKTLTLERSAPTTPETLQQAPTLAATTVPIEKAVRKEPTPTADVQHSSNYSSTPEVQQIPISSTIIVPLQQELRKRSNFNNNTKNKFTSFNFCSD